MTYNIDNLTAGLATFTKDNTSRYQKAIKNFNNKLTAGIPHRRAVDDTLKEAVYGLKEPEAKLQIARKAAGVLTPTQRVQTGASNATTKVLTQVKTIKVPKRKGSRGPIRRIIEKREIAKVHASKDPSIPPKVRKGPIIGWFLIGIVAGFVITTVVQGIAWFTTGVVWNPLVPWYLIYPLAILLCTIHGYRMGLRPKSTEDSEDSPHAQPIHHTA